MKQVLTVNGFHWQSGRLLKFILFGPRPSIPVLNNGVFAQRVSREVWGSNYAVKDIFNSVILTPINWFLFFKEAWLPAGRKTQHLWVQTFQARNTLFKEKIKGFIIQLSKAITYFSVPRQNMSIFFPNNKLLLENLTHKSSDSVRKTKYFPVVLNGPDSSQWQKT